MRVFVTGATGFIGSAIVKELIGAGHQVTGLARSQASAGKLIAAGAQALPGDIESPEILRRGAAAADGVIHTAFFHQAGHLNLGKRLRVIFGGLPGGIVRRFLTAALAADRRAVEILGRALAAPDRPLVAAFGTLAMKPGRLATEDDAHDPNAAGGPRGATEETMRMLASLGVRSSVIRLPPVVHGAGDRGGLVPQLIRIARKTKESVYVGDGRNRWPAAHVLDVARLFRLALEKGAAGGTYHGVAEEGVPFRDIASLIAKRLDVPAVGKAPAEAAKQLGFLGPFVPVDNPTSSRLTQERLGWLPSGPGVLADLDQSSYFSA